jgi:signal peptidase I
MPKKNRLKDRQLNTSASSPEQLKSTPPNSAQSEPHSGFVAIRETIESIVVAFVLAFLFRTFEAEAFVIPTGSMSPALQGRHKDVSCDQCGYRFRTTASSEESDVVQRWHSQLQHSSLRVDQREQLKYQIRSQDVLAGVCPMCRYTMPFRKDLPVAVQDLVDREDIEEHPSYPGDRILVNKYSYDSCPPERWDVVVFKFPGNGSMNYIKRLVGLPGETLRVYQGDLFTSPPGQDQFRIQRKPPATVRAMLQPVHDTDYESVQLYQAGWPLRWAATTSAGWEIEVVTGEKTGKKNVVQRFLIDQTETEGTHEESTAWIHYRHLLPDNLDWQEVLDWQEERAIQSDGSATTQANRTAMADAAHPQLIADFNAYNARILRGTALHGTWQVEPSHWPHNWVGDLAVACHVNVVQAEGELILNLVEGGKQFTCQIDLKSGQATLNVESDQEDANGFPLTASTGLNSPGNYHLLFTNVDDQLLLWVDDTLVDFGDTSYDASQLYGGRSNIYPRSGDDRGGDLAPVGIGARGASLTISRLQVMRDIYYVATNPQDSPHDPEYTRIGSAAHLADGTTVPPIDSQRQLFSNPKNWPRFGTRRHRDFPISDKQYFVCGDNSPESADCRLWKSSTPSRGIPGGSYLDQRLLTGKAVCVFWPHSWGGIPGLPKLPGFPNFGDIRIVR